MNTTRNVLILMTCFSLFVGGFIAGCGPNSQEGDSSGDTSDGAGVEDAVEYGTGEKQIEMGNEMKDSLDESTQKKENQLEQVQDSSD